MHVSASLKSNVRRTLAVRSVVLSDRAVMLRRRAILAAGAAGVALLGLTTYAHAQTISVVQVEAGISALQPAFAPVEFVFGGVVSSTTTDPRYGSVSFSNIYSGLTTTSASLSSHAQAVGDSLYGPGTPGAGAISRVFTSASAIYNTNGAVGATPFFTNNLGVINLPSSQVGAVPAGAPAGVRVINNSYVYQYTDETVNIQAARRVDFMINRDNVVWVAGAVTGTQFVGGTGATTLGWRPRNGIAVSSPRVETPFDPTLGSAFAYYGGRGHADVSSDTLASFGSARVAGSSAALIQQANVLGTPSGGDARVVKSLIMTGAVITGTRSTSNNLSTLFGTGNFNHANSLAILNAGQRTFASTSVTGVTTNIATGTVPSLSSQGWALSSAPASSSSVVLVHFAGQVTGLTSTINWNWTSGTVSAGTQVDTNDAALVASDLSYELRPVTWNGTNYALAARLTDPSGRLLNSDAFGLSNDNVEHIYIDNGVTAALNPGTYALVTRNKETATAVTTALTYRATVGSVPTWNINADAVWSTTASNNWTGSYTPNGFSQTANFGAATITSPRAITLSSFVTLGTLSFSGNANYTITPSTTQTITLNNAGLGASSVVSSGGSQTINARLVNTAGNTTVAVSGSSTLTVATVTNSRTFTVTGPGVFAVSSSLTNAGAIGGALVVGPTGVARFTNPGGTSFTQVLSQASVNLAGTSSTTDKATLEFTGNSTLPRGTKKANVVVVDSLTIAGTSPNYFGFLDLGASDMVVVGGNLTTLRQYVAAWYNGGTVTSVGVGSSLAGGAANPYTIAVFPNIDSGGNAYFDTYDDVALTTADVILKFTYKGDTNLDGILDGSDAANIIEGLTTGATGWQNGDINYDGAVTAADFILFNTHLSNQLGGNLGNGSNVSGGGGGQIPEPAALGLLALAAPFALRTRRRA